MGAAVRRMSSDPVPLLNMIGNRPAMIAATVIIMGRTRIIVIWPLRTGVLVAPISFAIAATTQPENQATDCEKAHSQSQQVIYQGAN